jgi:hypothetical protein
VIQPGPDTYIHAQFVIKVISQHKSHQKNDHKKNEKQKKRTARYKIYHVENISTAPNFSRFNNDIGSAFEKRIRNARASTKTVLRNVASQV